MSKQQTTRKRVWAKAIELLKDTPDGFRYSEFVRELQSCFPSTPVKTIQGAVWNLDQVLPDTVYKPSRGLFRHVDFSDEAFKKKATRVGPKIREDDFYKLFADWLINDLEECTQAISLGRNKFRDKWGTPDVIGKREARRSDIVPGPTEIVSAEVKLDGNQLITAFGQACAYRLFSHKAYLVVPYNAPKDDLARLDALCMLYGIGLVHFNPASPKDPNFDIQVRAQRHEPDMFYLNKCMAMIEEELFS